MRTLNSLTLPVGILALSLAMVSGAIVYALSRPVESPEDFSRDQVEKFSREWWAHRPAYMRAEIETPRKLHYNYLETEFPVEKFINVGVNTGCCQDFSFRKFNNRSHKNKFILFVGHHMSGGWGESVAKFLSATRKLLEELPVEIEIWYLRTDRLRTDERVFSHDFIALCTEPIDKPSYAIRASDFKFCYDKFLVPASKDFWLRPLLLRNSSSRWNFPWLLNIYPEPIKVRTDSVPYAYFEQPRTPLRIRQEFRRVLLDNGYKDIPYYPAFFDERPPLPSFARWIGELLGE